MSKKALAKQPAQQEPVAKPYAYEYGRDNGDGTYSVVIEKGDLVQTAPAVYNYVRPRNAHKDWPIKELFDRPPPQRKPLTETQLKGEHMKGPYLEKHELEQLEALLPHAIKDTMQGWKSNRLRGGSASMAFYGNVSSVLLKAFDDLAAEIRAQPEQDTNIKESLTTGSCIACGNRMTGSPESFVVATAEVGVTAPEGYSPQQVEALHPHKGGDKTAPPLAEPEQEPVASIGSLNEFTAMELVRRGFALTDPLYTAPPQRKPLTDNPEWIVNDLGELGVKVGHRFFFLYKGNSLEYGKNCAGETALHEDGTPMRYRIVGKREFGETCWPLSWVTQGHEESRYTVELEYMPGLSFGKPEDGEWKPLPSAHGIKGEA